ncbi:transposase [Herbaspirillum sp.]|uniref:IS66-like element accessory protein TnpA n=1 Tax=Herbaspirillum sp. TaxID=1890675 RepID=UPI0025854E46|nr:transposase [Herbaspirillum sp.]
MEIEVEHSKRRRSANYPLEFKRQLAQQACDSAVSVSQLALQHGLNTNMLFRWRRQLMAGQLDQAKLVPVTLAQASPISKGQAGSGMIEICIGEAAVRIEGSPDPATLTLVLKALRA